MPHTARTSRRGRGATAAATVSALALLAACTGAPDADAPSGGQAGTTAAPADQATTSGAATTSDAAGSTGGALSTDQPQAGTTAAPTTPAGPVPEGLETFYSQALTWQDCDGFQCATMQVPLDYQDPAGQAIQVSLLKVPAGGERQGSLVVNPGGPGGSGVDYARMAEMVLPSDVRAAYDVVGFDPRGVGRSTPIDCLTDEELDDFLGSDPSPDDAAEEKASEELLTSFGAKCEEKAGELLDHVSTPEVARDMDVLRAVLGEEQLDYLGASYGTYLGATYASLFPKQVGRFVLDGAVDPTLSALDMGLGQAEGFERATRAYVESCVSKGDCPLGDDVDSAMKAIPAFLDDLDANPVKVSGDKVDELTEGWGMLGIIVAMYDQTAWPVLTQALDQAKKGNGTMLMFLANIYATRNSQGTYDGNGMEAIYAVNCIDRPTLEDTGMTEEEIEKKFETVSPTWGRYLAGDGACGDWPATAAETVTDFSAEGAAPIVVVGTTRDPATPHEWAVSLADILSSGVLISYDGDGHTAYGRSNDCVDDAINDYLLEGTVPEDGLTC